MEDIAFCSATDLIDKIRNREIDARELLEHTIARIETLNESINAVVVTDYENARIQAKAADEALSKGEIRGPLHGLPITIKEAIAVAGLPLTAGSQDMTGHKPGRHADVVQSLVDAGAVILGKTNMPLFGMDFQSYNEIYGQTNNPWDLSLTPGGSSGGAAAALAAGMTALEIGSDFGGSIRLPAAFCGLFGHKPTFNIVPLTGHIPELADILVVGPLARSAKDLDAVMQLITQPDKSQRTAWSVNLPQPRKKKLQDYRVGLWLDDPRCPVDEAVGKRLQIFVDRLAKAGVQIENRRPDIEFSKGLEVYVGLAAAISGANLPDGVFQKIRAEAGQHQENETNIRARFIKGAVQSYRQWKLLDDQRRSMQHQWAEFFKDYDVLLCPAVPVTAFEHDHTPFYDRELNVNNEQRSYVDTLQSWAGLTGIAYLPATVAPIGQTDEGLPVGVQIVGPYLEDRTAINFAKLMEETLGGFMPPPLCDI